MKYLKDMLDLDGLVNDMESRLEIARNQIEIIYDKAVADISLTDKEKLERFDQINIPVKILLDYLHEIEVRSKMIRQNVNHLYDEAVKINGRLSFFDDMEAFMQLDDEEKSMAMHMVVSVGKIKKAMEE